MSDVVRTMLSVCGSLPHLVFALLLALSLCSAVTVPGEAGTPGRRIQVNFLSRGQTLRHSESQHWAELRDMLSEASLAEIQRFASPPDEGRLGLALLTTLFVPGQAHASLHTVELFTALVINLFNPHIGQVHLLLESQTDECQWFPDLLTKFLPAAPWTNDTLAKIMCTPVAAQPTYADLFRYANGVLANRLVLLANTDVAFDESLGLITPEAFAEGHQGLVLSVHSPPYSAKYKELIGSDCTAETRCVVGNLGSPSGWGATSAGTSWDAYLFRAPLAAEAASAGGGGPGVMNLSHVESVMNRIGAENNAAYELEVSSRVRLSNPCLHVKAAHYHCIGGKMHKGGRQSHIDGGELRSLGTVMPCWDCPGVTMPAGAVPSANLCGGGQALEVTPERLGQEFPQHGARQLMCCAATEGCEHKLMTKMQAGSLQLCQTAADTDCIISHGELTQHRVY